MAKKEALSNSQLEKLLHYHEDGLAQYRMQMSQTIQLLEELTILAIKDLQSYRSRWSLTIPKIVCLCGSTRFTREMLIKQWELTKQGYIVLSWCALPDDYYPGSEKAHIGDQEGVKELVDEVHKRKIDLADEVFILNIGGYIGDSTRSELEYAIKCNKPISFLINPSKEILDLIIIKGELK